MITINKGLASFDTVVKVFKEYMDRGITVLFLVLDEMEQNLE